MSKKKSFFLLYLALFIYSLSSVCTKFASKQELFSLKYIIFACGIFVFLGIYAFFWQQVLESIQLSVAMANRPLTLVFSILWAVFLFGEKVDIKTLFGIIMIIVGGIIISLFSYEK